MYEIDERAYILHKDDSIDRCFLCKRHTAKSFLVRQISSGKMIHLCRECMVDYPSEYLLDNTCVWMGPASNK
ncbi:MAG: hypothetical protein U9P80_04620 [Thermodesulfobacteriota bacterium]|nr:hypothetical protein [Thermodesulfobacteriota bacterium]